MKKKTIGYASNKKAIPEMGKERIDKMGYINDNHKIIITKNEKDLYDYELLEYSKICNCWNKIGKYTNFTKEALESWLDINIDSLEEGATNG